MTAPEPNERERQIARGTCDLRDAKCRDRTCDLCDAIALALARYRAEVVEACAQIVEVWVNDDADVQPSLRDLAAAIRARR